MAPTIQTGHLNDKRSVRNTDKKSDLACRIKYCNTLPDIPFDPKFITYPFESNRFVQYNPTSLERNYKHDLLTEHDLGVPIDLINSDTYAINENASLGALDEKLLEEEIATIQDSKRSRHHAKSVSWLRRTEYISTEYTRFQPSSDKTETKVGYNVKRFFKEEDLYMDRDSQIKAIDKTFSDSKKSIEKHHTKPNVTPLETLSLFPDFEYSLLFCLGAEAQTLYQVQRATALHPVVAMFCYNKMHYKPHISYKHLGNEKMRPIDIYNSAPLLERLLPVADVSQDEKTGWQYLTDLFPNLKKESLRATLSKYIHEHTLKMWRYPCAQVIFDSDPASIGRPLPAQLDEMSQAMIRGVMDESGEQFVAYFLPTDDTLKKRKRDTNDGVEYLDDEEYEYTMAREYNWNVKNKASKGYEENYFFVFRNEGVYYNELETRVRLNKRRLRPGAQPNNSRLVVHHRPLNELEFKTQEVRMMQLEPQQEEEEMPQQQDDDGEQADEMEQNLEMELEAKMNDNDKADSQDEKDEVSSANEEDNRKENEEESDNESDANDSLDGSDERKANGSAKADQVNGDRTDPVVNKEYDTNSSSSSSESNSSSDGESGDSSSSSESEQENDVDSKNKRDEAEIFGSDSDRD